MCTDLICSHKKAIPQWQYQAQQGYSAVNRIQKAVAGKLSADQAVCYRIRGVYPGKEGAGRDPGIGMGVQS